MRLIFTAITLIMFTTVSGYVHPYKNRLVRIQELSLLLNLTIMYAVSYQCSGAAFSIVTNIMISLALTQFCIIVLYHFFTYTCHCNVATTLQAIVIRLMRVCSRKKHYHQNINEIALLNIPNRTYNYSEYRDGLISDDFEYNNMHK